MIFWNFFYPLHGLWYVTRANKIIQVFSKKYILKKLQKIIADLTDDEQLSIQHYFFEERTMKQIGVELGIRKMAISKQLKNSWAECGDLWKHRFLYFFKKFLKFDLQKRF